MIRLDLQYRQIAARILADDFGGISRGVLAYGHLHPAGVGDDVRVGDNVSFRVNQEAGAGAFHGNGIHEEIVGDGLRGDVDNRGTGVPVNFDVITLVGAETGLVGSKVAGGGLR